MVMIRVAVDVSPSLSVISYVKVSVNEIPVARVILELLDHKELLDLQVLLAQQELKVRKDKKDKLVELVEQGQQGQLDKKVLRGVGGCVSRVCGDARRSGSARARMRRADAATDGWR